MEYTRDIPYIEVTNPIVGSKYHLSWAGHGCVWRLKEIKGEWVKLETPKTRKERWAKRADLRHVRRTQYKIEKGL
jgi:G:T-mismatch repair DNA endonuclease (very short patch repair protein)